ncbi:MAG TPA: type II secretion system protein GspN [Kofleriaceae bacterium]|nr:type II secretion system protein GspN [Kofleriaceae bacterium]
MRRPAHILASLTPLQRKIVKGAAYTLLAIATFLIALSFVFPYDRVKGKLVEVLSEKYDVTVGDVGRGLLPGQVVFDRVVLRTRPTKPDEKPKEIVIDRLEIDLGLDYNLIGAIRKKVAVDIEVEMGGGEIEGEIDASQSLVAAHFETSGLPLGNLPGVADAVGLPMTGDLDADIDIRLPGGKWKDAEGRIEVDCDGCIVGDGVSKMTLASNRKTPSGRTRRATPGWGDEARSITVPKLALSETNILVEIKNGIGEIKNFSAESKDGWLKIAGKIEFKDPFANSLFPGCMQFKLSDELKKREPNFGNIEFGISEKLRQADGSYAIPTRGKLTELRWDPKRKCGGGEAEEGDEGDGTPGLAKLPALTPDAPVTAPATGGEPALPVGTETGAPPPGTSGPPLTEPPTGAHDAGAGGPGADVTVKPPAEQDDREVRERENGGDVEPLPQGGDEGNDAPADRGDDRDNEDRRDENTNVVD